MLEGYWLAELQLEAGALQNQPELVHRALCKSSLAETAPASPRGRSMMLMESSSWGAPGRPSKTEFWSPARRQHAAAPLELQCVAASAAIPFVVNGINH
jgi:hypothetical protein